jgi:hypothetical protein
MTITQAQAVWELCRQGLPLSADEAERCWAHGDSYHLDQRVKVPRGLIHMIARCNREARLEGSGNQPAWPRSGGIARGRSSCLPVAAINPQTTAG